MQVQRGNLWNTAADDARHGRIGHIPLTWLLYIPYFFKSEITVRIFSMAAVLFDMAALFLLIKNSVSKYAASLSCILFISFACISNQHNLFVSYIIGHQIPSGMVLFALNEFVKYYTDGHKASRLAASSLLLTAASVLYEACPAYIILFLMISFSANKGTLFSRIKASLKELRFHAALLSAYILVYAGWRIIHPSDYSGSVLYFGNIPQSMVTMLKYSFGMTPGLPAAAMLIKKYVSASELLNSLRIWMIAAPAAAAVSFYFLFPKTELKNNRAKYILYCISGILIPNIIICFTPKYTEWASGTSYSYVTSFYSYFFLVPLFILISGLIPKNNSKPVRIILSSAVFAVSLVCTVNNTAWNCYFEKNLCRYRAFSESVADDFFDGLEDGTTVFIPDYSGIHNDMSITRSFSQIYTDSDISFTNEIDSIDFSGPVVFLKYHHDENCMTAGTLNPDLSVSDTFCIYGENTNESVPVFMVNDN